VGGDSSRYLHTYSYVEFIKFRKYFGTLVGGKDSAGAAGRQPKNPTLGDSAGAPKTYDTIPLRALLHDNSDIIDLARAAINLVR
jgi:hypothetical protein